jgi:hypothetical protein
MCVAFADEDNDGFMDISVANDTQVNVLFTIVATGPLKRSPAPPVGKSAVSCFLAGLRSYPLTVAPVGCQSPAMPALR